AGILASLTRLLAQAVPYHLIRLSIADGRTTAPTGSNNFMPFPVKYRSRAILQIRYAILALAGVVLFGTIGFKIIEGWSMGDSFYVTVQTLTTVGYGDIPPHSATGRAFAVVVMLIGVGGVALAA